MSEDKEPRWIRDIVALWWREARGVFVTFGTFVWSPRQFGERWVRGEAPMNPIGYVVASATALLPFDYGMQKLLGWDNRPDVGIAVTAARAARPFLFAIVLGLACHGIFWLLGSRRRATTSIAIGLYSTVWSWLLWCLGLLFCWLTGADDRVLRVTMLLTIPWAGLALAGAHRIAWWWGIATLVGTGFVVISAVNFVLELAGLT